MTIIEVADGSFIAGDPVAELSDGQHWCTSCGRDGIVLDLNWNDDLVPTICTCCDGAGVVSCGGVNCDICERVEREQALELWQQRCDRLGNLEELCLLAMMRVPIDRAWDHEMPRLEAVRVTCDDALARRPSLSKGGALS